MKRSAVCVLSLSLVLAGFVGKASASTILLDIEDPAAQTLTPFTLNILATASTTTVTFEGYQVPSFEDVEDISLTTGGGPNLLGPTWTFTPAPSGSDTSIFNDGFGTGVPALSFGGITEDSFDQYAQTVATVAGDSYALQFLFTNPTGSPSQNAPSELLVTTSGNAGVAAVPEPASLTLLGSGLVGLVTKYARRRRKNTAV